MGIPRSLQERYSLSYMWGFAFLAYGKRLYYHTISLRVDILVYKTSLIPPHFNNVPVLSQEHDMCQICFCFYDIPSRFWNGSDDVVCFWSNKAENKSYHIARAVQKLVKSFEVIKRNFTSFCTALAMWYDLFSLYYFKWFYEFCTALTVWYDLFSALLLQMILRVFVLLWRCGMICLQNS
jgi:hypothetical protein